MGTPGEVLHPLEVGTAGVRMGPGTLQAEAWAAGQSLEARPES